MKHIIAHYSNLATFLAAYFIQFDPFLFGFFPHYFPIMSLKIKTIHRHRREIAIHVERCRLRR